MTQEVDGSWINLKYKVIEIGAVVMDDSKALWRWD